MSGGSAFQSLTVLGKKDILLFSVPQVIVWKAREWLCLVGLFCGVNLESLLMATSPLSILYIMQRRMSFLLFSRLRIQSLNPGPKIEYHVGTIWDHILKLGSNMWRKYRGWWPAGPAGGECWEHA